MSKITLDSLVQKGSAGASISPVQARAREPATVPPGGQSYWKAMTVKLDRTQYNALKVHGVVQNRTSQDCISEAIDMWLAYQERNRDTE